MKSRIALVLLRHHPVAVSRGWAASCATRTPGSTAGRAAAQDAQARRTPNVLHDLLGRRLRRHGVLSHFHLHVGSR